VLPGCYDPGLVSGPAKDPDDDERGAPRAAPAEQAATARAAPARAAQVSRPLSRPLFDLDLPGAPASSSAQTVGLDELPAAAIARGDPANDGNAAPVNPAERAVVPRPVSKNVFDSNPAPELVNDQFASLSSTSQLEGLPDRTPQETPRTGMRALTHVGPSASFDVTLKLPKPAETLEGRRSRLTGRFKATVAAYKVLSGLGLEAAASKELVELFNAYEGRLRASVPEEQRKLELETLHAELPLAAVEELERTASRLEERLLAHDDMITELDFRAKVSRAKQPAKVLLRYARLLAAKRFNIGYRRDRFEYLALELLTTTGSDQRAVLAPRDKAASVLTHLLSGLNQTTQPEERAPAIAHLLEALERLDEISSPREFFDSEFFLDLHGYKISMRDQVICPEFLYLSAALYTEIHNRMLAWSQSGSGSLEALRTQLQSQKAAAEDVFANFRRPRATPAPSKPSPKPPLGRLAPPAAGPPREGATATAAAAPAAGPRTRTRKRRRGRASVAPQSSRKTWLKLGAIALVIVGTTLSALHSADVIRLSAPPVVLTGSELHRLSPILASATLHDGGRRLEALVSRPAWQRLKTPERRDLANALVDKLKAKGIQNANLRVYKSPVMQIEYTTVVYLEETAAVR